MENTMSKWNKLLACGLLLTLTAPLGAILPPLFQTAEEIQTILKGNELGRVLPSGEPIVEIRKTDSGYELLTAHYRLQAEISYLPQKQPGPAQFKVHYSQAEKRTDVNR
jgi:hypothetical protein